MNKSDVLVGVLGGMGPAATVCFSEQLVERTRAACDQDHICTLVLNDASIPDRTQFLLGNSEDSPLPKLISGARLLQSAGCSFIAMPCNTAHSLFDELTSSVDIPVLNMVADTARECGRRGIKRVGVLATEGTVKVDVYGKALRNFGLECIYPNAEIQHKTNEIINDWVKSGVSVPQGALADACGAMAAMGCDGVVLGCTELSVAYEADSACMPIAVVDSLRVLVDSTIAAAGAQLAE
ncbi:amino acid racemase [Adlercreutzia sp. ZJ304]|uniref:aspartate/glutamate racemase family protein n=1 Tax=Adlercreutzia sp. ZJ304 TaxID=2709791 RepID=UPI0013EB04FA|nr:amino acid racemase [Adlercreutzia sp. ZJ304]